LDAEGNENNCNITEFTVTQNIVNYSCNKKLAHNFTFIMSHANESYPGLSIY